MVRRNQLGSRCVRVSVLAAAGLLATVGAAFAQAPSIDLVLDEVSPNAIRAGEPVTVRWTVVNARSVVLQRPDLSTVAVDPYGWDTQRFASPGTKKFTLIVVGLDGATYDKTVCCLVRPNEYRAVPQIEFAAANPYPQIGEEVRLTWHVSDARQVRLCDPEGHGGVVPLNGVKTMTFSDPGRKRFYLYVHDRTGRRFLRWVDVLVAERPR